MLKLVLVSEELRSGDVVKLNRNPDILDFLLSFMFVLRLPAVSVKAGNRIEGRIDSAQFSRVQQK